MSVKKTHPSERPELSIYIGFARDGLAVIEMRVAGEPYSHVKLTADELDEHIAKLQGLRARMNDAPSNLQ